MLAIYSNNLTSIYWREHKDAATQFLPWETPSWGEHCERWPGGLEDTEGSPPQRREHPSGVFKKDWDDYNSFPSPKGALLPGGHSTLTSLWPFLGLCSPHFPTAFGDSGWCLCAAAGKVNGSAPQPCRRSFQAAAPWGRGFSGQAKQKLNHYPLPNEWPLTCKGPRTRSIILHFHPSPHEIKGRRRGREGGRSMRWVSNKNWSAFLASLQFQVS